MDRNIQCHLASFNYIYSCRFHINFDCQTINKTHLKIGYNVSNHFFRPATGVLVFT